MATRFDADYGIGTHEIAGGAGGLETAAAFTARLREHFASPGYTPPLLPAIALEVHELAQKADVDLVRVITVLEKDPVLAGRVLKIAQSAAFAPAGAILSLRDAVVRIGLRNLREIVWEVALNMRVFRSQKYQGPMEAVRRHSAACAHLARAVSSFTSIATDYAFLCGLLHDIGMAAALIVLGEQEKAAPEDALLGAILRGCHAEASQVVATLWKMPADVQLVLANHHAVVVQGYVHPLTAIVAVAEQLAGELGQEITIGEEACDSTDETALARARGALNLDDRRMGLLRQQAKLVIAGVEDAARPPG